MASSCLSRGAKVSRPEVRSKVIAALDVLARGAVLYLKHKAIDALAGLETTEANDVLRSHFRKEDGKLDFESYASKYAVRIDGISASAEMVEAFIRHEDTPRETLEALRCLPRDRLIPILVDFINNDTYPKEKHPEQNFCVRHRRRDSARLLADIAEWESLPYLQAALRNARHTDYVREGMVRAIATLPGERATRLLQDILADGTLPADCRVTAAAFLGDGCPEAGSYLRRLVADKTADHYDRRDAASALQKFALSPTDVPIFIALLSDDRPEVFWGGPAYAVEALHRIDDPLSKAAIANAEYQWRRSANPNRGLVLQRIAARSKPAGAVLNRAELARHLASIGRNNWNDSKQIILDYYSRNQSDIQPLFEEWLVLPTDECCFAPTEAATIIGILDQKSITQELSRVLTALALHFPWDEGLWHALVPYDSLLEPS